jgi:hypothetical protein
MPSPSPLSTSPVEPPEVILPVRTEIPECVIRLTEGTPFYDLYVCICRLHPLIIDFAVVFPLLKFIVGGATKTIRELTMLSAIALSTFALVKMSGSAAYPGRLYPGALCLTCDKGGSDCNFTSYAEYLEAESGIGAVWFDDIAISLTTAKGRIQGHHQYESRAQRYLTRRTDAMISTAFGFYFGRAADGLNNFSPFI